MTIRTFGALCTATFCLLVADDCFARPALFYKVSRNYDSEGHLGTVYRQELETRMFTHATWRQRLYCNSYEPDIDDTLEIYSKADGSPWLSYCRATPSLSRFISDRIWLGEQFDLKKKLDGVSLRRHELALPADVAKEIELLWRAMLPGLPKDPDPEERIIVAHAPAIIAFAKEDESVITGRIAMSAYNMPPYRAFMDIVGDLIKVSSGRVGPQDPTFRRLPSKVRDLRAALNGKR